MRLFSRVQQLMKLEVDQKSSSLRRCSDEAFLLCAEDKNFHLKLSKMLYYNILRRLFADVLMFKHELP